MLNAVGTNEGNGDVLILPVLTKKIIKSFQIFIVYIRDSMVYINDPITTYDYHKVSNVENNITLENG